MDFRKRPKSLADEIRESEGPFIEAATEALRARVAEEYRRLRGYALEAGSDEIRLKLEIACQFAPNRISVCVVSRPVFAPAAGTTQLMFNLR